MARSKKKGPAKKASSTQGSAAPSAPKNRITVEAQGGGTQESERWASPERPPTVAEVLDMLDRLEAKLTDTQRQQRQTAFAQARAHVPRLAAAGVSAPPKMQFSFPQPPLKGGIRVDINIFEGRIVP
jgi:hypothetical protein